MRFAFVRCLVVLVAGSASAANVTMTRTANVIRSQTQGAGTYDQYDLFYTSAGASEFTNWRIIANATAGNLADPAKLQDDRQTINYTNEANTGGSVDTFANTVWSAVGKTDLGYGATQIYNVGSYVPSGSGAAAPFTFLDWSILDTLDEDDNDLDDATNNGPVAATAPYHLARILTTPNADGTLQVRAFDTSAPGVPFLFNFDIGSGSFWNNPAGGNWNNSANWSTGVVPNGPADTAQFGVAIGSTPAVINLDADITVSQITFDNNLGSYTVADGGPFDLTLAGPAIVDVEAGSHEISAPIVGSSGLNKTGPGTLTLSGSKTYTGATQVAQGTLVVQNSELPGESIDVAAGATLLLDGYTFYFMPANQTLSGSGDVDVDGPFPNSLLIPATSAIRGSLNIESGVVINSGLIAPGNTPGTFEIININGAYDQNADGVLEIEVGGLTAGTQHDKLVVTGSAAPDGRLDVPIRITFDPMLNDEIIIISAAEVIEGEQFNSIFTPGLAGANPNVDLAIEVIYNPEDVRLRFVAPTPKPFNNDAPTTTSWTNPIHATNPWGGPVPTTTNDVEVRNTTGVARQINVMSGPSVPNAFAHSLTISGDTNTMTVRVQNGKSLSVTTDIAINNNGIVVQDSGSTLVSPTVEVGSGGLLAGNGTIIGDVKVGTAVGAQNAVFSPGLSPGHKKIIGGFEQGNGGTTIIEVQGINPGQFDTVEVTGEAKLGGTLRVEVSNPAVVAEGDTLLILTAGSLTTDQVFKRIETIGHPDLFFALNYPNLSDGAGQSDHCQPSRCLLRGEWITRGDMNHDGEVDSLDIPLFALALTNQDAYADSMTPNGALIGDFGQAAGDLGGLPNGDPDGRLDFDDINDFAVEVDMSAAALMAEIQRYQTTVPEPTSAVFVVVAGMFAVGLRRRLGLAHVAKSEQ